MRLLSILDTLRRAIQYKEGTLPPGELQYLPLFMLGDIDEE